MPTASECRQREQVCLHLAKSTVDFYAKCALIERAADFARMAEGQEQALPDLAKPPKDL